MEPAKLSALFGHSSAATSELASELEIEIRSEVDSEIEVAIFAINAQTGIDQNTIDLWHSFDDFLTPRILLITGLDEGEQDFDDAVLIARRVLDEVVTPYLVLHDDSGKPAGLISLVDSQVIDYEKNESRVADEDLVILVSEFKSEYLSQLDALGADGFENGILFPAIPVILPKIGVDIVKQYLHRITKR